MMPPLSSFGGNFHQEMMDGIDLDYGLMGGMPNELDESFEESIQMVEVRETYAGASKKGKGNKPSKHNTGTRMNIEATN